jgi:hypothetical protein
MFCGCFGTSLEGIMVALPSTETTTYVIDSNTHTIRYPTKLPQLLSQLAKNSILAFSACFLDYSGPIQALEARFICFDYLRMCRIHAAGKIEWIRSTGAMLRLLATAENNLAPLSKLGNITHIR